MTDAFMATEANKQLQPAVHFITDKYIMNYFDGKNIGPEKSQENIHSFPRETHVPTAANMHEIDEKVIDTIISEHSADLVMAAKTDQAVATIINYSIDVEGNKFYFHAHHF